MAKFFLFVFFLLEKKNIKGSARYPFWFLDQTLNESTDFLHLYVYV